jgi:hypothetical protein
MSAPVMKSDTLLERNAAMPAKSSGAAEAAGIRDAMLNRRCDPALDQPGVAVRSKKETAN